MPERFPFDVFISHSSKDKAVVRPIAARLKSDGLRVWFDEWEVRPGDNIYAKVEDGLEQSRVLVLCMSSQALGSDWARLEAGTFRFRDPLNKERRFIPLRLDNAQIKGSLAQLLFIDWRDGDHEQPYSKLLEACRPPGEQSSSTKDVPNETTPEWAIKLDSKAPINAYAFSPDGERILSAGNDKTLRLWDARSGCCLRVLAGHEDQASALVWSFDQKRALSSSRDRTLRLWNVDDGSCMKVLEGHKDGVSCVGWSDKHRVALSGGRDNTVRLWDLDTPRCIKVLEGHSSDVTCVSWGIDQRFAISGSSDKTIRVWDAEEGRCVQVLEGHTDAIDSVVASPDRQFALSSSWDSTIRLWHVQTGRCVHVLKGHHARVLSIAWGARGRFAASGSWDSTVRLWDVDNGRSLRVFSGHGGYISAVAWNQDQTRLLSGDITGGIRIWKVSGFCAEGVAAAASESTSISSPAQLRYTNAKVLLVGESGVGKTGLSMRLAGDVWRPSDSTVGAWATQWKLAAPPDSDIQREIWLWDFGGQADQRLVHQLYMDDTAVAVLVFDGQKENIFETLSQWDRDLTHGCSTRRFVKLLVAARIDAGGLRISRAEIERFASEHGFAGVIETSAKKDIGCQELRTLIAGGIAWESIPWQSSPTLFKRLKDEIIRLRDAGRVLMRINELRDALRLQLIGTGHNFSDEELKAVVSLLSGPGVVWELGFGRWVLLQPERINAYAQAVIHTLRTEEHERGCILEERILSGLLTYRSSMGRLDPEEERFVLLGMHRKLVQRGLCLREYTEKGTLLIFPSYYRRERPRLTGHPAVLVTYNFAGFLDEIYATLVVRLHHTKPFQQDQLWRYAADFRTLTGKKLGLKLTRVAEGAGKLDLYFDPAIPIEEKIIFSRYVHEHLLQNAQEVIRYRQYVCLACKTPVGNIEVAMRRLRNWLEAKDTLDTDLDAASVSMDAPTIVCAECEARVPLWDELEQCFGSPETLKQVRELRQQSATVLDQESEERALVGEVISTVSLAGQISREFKVSDRGIDMEIEFTNDAGLPTGQRVYLQLTLNDTELQSTTRDRGKLLTNAEDEAIVMIRNIEYSRYWMDQPFPVLLVMRTLDGEVRWMDVREWLKRANAGAQRPVDRIIFRGERFDVLSVRRWRDTMLAQASS
jgi:small GTP-binding protein